MYGVYKGSTVAMRDCVECLGGVIDKLRYIFFYMVMLCLGGVHGPAKSVWAGYLQKLLIQLSGSYRGATIWCILLVYWYS